MGEGILTAIILACQVNGAGIASLDKTAKYQLDCQKELIVCYEKNHPGGTTDSPGEWPGVLKSCLMQKQVKTSQ